MTFKPAINVPPEWAPQTAIWAGWPHLREEWKGHFDGAQAEIAALVKELARKTPVTLLIGDLPSRTAAEDAIGSAASLHELPMGDIWLRDIGPLVASRGSKPVGLTFSFNGWGGKYDFPGDQETASAICKAEDLPEERHSFVLEGGAIEQDGEGLLLTTRQCLLNPNRNPGWDQAAAETALKATFGAERVFWLDEGLRSDHTDGHIDNLARFVGPGRVICQRPSGTNDPNADILRQTERDLKAMGLDVFPLPSPGRIMDGEGQLMPASHMNFLISNGKIFLPVYEDIYSAQAAEGLAEALPGYDIVPLYAGNILTGGGAFHCMTQQIPQI